MRLATAPGLAGQPHPEDASWPYSLDAAGGLVSSAMLQAADDHREFTALGSWMRVSDREREHAARQLRDAAIAGALSAFELDRRLDRVLSAVTRGDLECVLLDLPNARPRRTSWLRRWLQSHLATYAIVNGGLIAIWAAAGFGYFWPVWPMIGWGMVIAGHAYSAFALGATRD
jgi:DUF1707 SHOCT-like domain/2TM domain